MLQPNGSRSANKRLHLMLYKLKISPQSGKTWLTIETTKWRGRGSPHAVPFPRHFRNLLANLAELLGERFLVQYFNGQSISRPKQPIQALGIHPDSFKLL
jgi:hypothetical protein